MTRPTSRLLGAVVALSATASLLTSAQSRQAASPTATPIDFNRQIRPLLSDRCYRCHGPDSAKRKAKLRLDTREGLFKEADNGLAVVAPRDVEKSDLIRRITSDDTEEMMPPPDSHLALTDGGEGAAEAVGGGGRGLQAALVAGAGRAGRGAGGS